MEDKCNQLEKKSAENDSRRRSESDKTSELDKKMEVVMYALIILYLHESIKMRGALESVSA